MNGYCIILKVEYVSGQMSVKLPLSISIVDVIISKLSEMAFLTGNPVPKITWHKDGQLVQEDEAHHIASGGRFLQITNAQVSHTGRYTCLASNTAGDKSKSFSLTVFGKYQLCFRS